MSIIIDYLEHVLKATGGAFFVNLFIYSQLVGISKQTAYNQLQLGTFPLKTVRLGRTVAIRAIDVATFLETGIRQSDPPQTKKSVGRGAPRKYSSAQRAAAVREKTERAEKNTAQRTGA